MSHALDALVYALTVNPQFGAGGRVLFLRAREHAELDRFAGRLVCQQTWKPYAQGLEAAGRRVEREAHGQFPLVLLLPDAQRELMMADLARGYEHLAPGGTLLVSQHNDAGGKRAQQLLAEVAGEVSTLSKHHCRVFWAVKDDANPWKKDLLESWQHGARMRRVLDGRFWSRPGLFSWDRIDEGSALLTAHLPHGLKGNVADLGCGWGFLSDFMLRHCHDIDTLDIYDADADCFECARRNLGLVPTRVRAKPHWKDVTAGLGTARYDAIVMNPPFHEGKRSDVLIGLKFIAAAAQALRPDGELWLVANRQLPYEEMLGEVFSQVDSVVENGAFKVLHAARPTVSAKPQRSREKRRSFRR